MRLRDYDNDDGKRVWLSDDELTRLIKQAETPHQRLAFLLAGRAPTLGNHRGMSVRPRRRTDRRPHPSLGELREAGQVPRAASPERSRYHLGDAGVPAE